AKLLEEALLRTRFPPLARHHAFHRTLGAENAHKGTRSRPSAGDAAPTLPCHASSRVGNRGQARASPGRPTVLRMRKAKVEWCGAPAASAGLRSRAFKGTPCGLRSF